MEYTTAQLILTLSAEEIDSSQELIEGIFINWDRNIDIVSIVFTKPLAIQYVNDQAAVYQDPETMIFQFCNWDEETGIILIGLDHFDLVYGSDGLVVGLVI